jgi:hypothetical protein
MGLMGGMFGGQGMFEHVAVALVGQKPLGPGKHETLFSPDEFRVSESIQYPCLL